MEKEEIIEEKEVDTRETGESESETTEKKFTQEQLNKLIGEARVRGREQGIKEGRESAIQELEQQLRDQASQKFREKYGVNDDDELDTIFGKGQQYDTLSEENETFGKQLKDKDAFIALLQSHIPQSRFDDVKAILGSKGLDITAENIQSELATHPEWMPASTPIQTSQKTISSLGPVVPDNSDPELTERDLAKKYFGY